MMRAALGGGLALFLGILLVAVTVGQSPAPPARGEAELRLVQGNEAFRAGRIDEAIAAYEDAYQLFPSAKLLYNLGQAYEAAGRQPEALGAYERFVNGVADAVAKDKDLAGRVAHAHERIAALRIALGVPVRAPPDAGAGRVDAGALPPAVVPAAPSLAPVVPALHAAPLDRPPTRWKWWAIGIGSVALAAVATFFLVARPGRPDCPKKNDLDCI